jgi:hypothetical protein
MTFNVERRSKNRPLHYGALQRRETTMPSVPPPNEYANVHYYDLIDEASLPIDQRASLPIGRDGSLIKMRRHHLMSEDVDALRKVAAGSKATEDTVAVAPDAFPNAFNRSNYFYIVESLKNLGINRWHDFSVLLKEIRRQMSLAATRQGEGDNQTTGWQRFANKESRSDQGLDSTGKVLQNIEVLQRVTGINAYGLKINQIGQEVLDGPGACIDLKRENDSSPIQVRLNTRPVDFLVVTPTMGSLKGKRMKIARPRNDLKNRRKVADNIKVVTVKPKAKTVKAVKAKPTVLAVADAIVNASESAEPTVVETAAVETAVAAV